MPCFLSFLCLPSVRGPFFLAMKAEPLLEGGAFQRKEAQVYPELYAGSGCVSTWQGGVRLLGRGAQRGSVRGDGNGP